MINLAILISGRGTNMTAILEAIRNKKITKVQDVVVISNNENALGLNIAREKFEVKTEIIPKTLHEHQQLDDKIDTILNSYNITPNNGLICLAGFMKILGNYIVNKYKHRIMNIHPSLLPSFKGLHAQRQAIKEGVKISGCTVHFVNDSLDGGPIILQACVPVHDMDDESSLSERILEKEHEIYVEAINLFTNNKLVLNENRVLKK